MDLNKRLKAVVNKDKLNNPKYLLDIIKSDFYYLISNYFEVDFDNISVEISTENNQYIISLNCIGDRIKMVRTLPDF